MTYLEASKKFKKYFNLSFSEFMCHITSKLNSVSIDIIKFDDYLIFTYGDYMDGKTSMNDFITKHFGKQAKDFIDLLV